MTKLFFALLIALGFTVTVHAQVASTAQQSATGTGSAVIAPGAVSITSNSSQLPWTTIDQNIHTNQAATAPTNIGSTSPGTNTGCPAVDGWSASIVVANGGKTTASELPGCMLNILGQNLGMLKEVEVTVNDSVTGLPSVVRRFDGLSIMRLETWCLYPLYKQAIENGMNYQCKSTRDALAGR